jgi:sarcosine oxidase subunit alpha
MSTRLAKHGRLIDRSKKVTFTFNGTSMQGFEGDTLASALLANDQMMMGRSFKYHRPRGVVASGAEEPNALVGLGQGNRFEPNQRATTTELFNGLTSVSQNHWPNLEFDIGAINTHLSRFLPAGFYYKMFPNPSGSTFTSPSSVNQQVWAKRRTKSSKMRIPMNTSMRSPTYW